MVPHDRALDDLVLLDVVEDLRRIAIGAFVDGGIRTLKGLRIHSYIVTLWRYEKRAVVR